MARILLAEDDEDMRRFLVKALQKAGYDVTDFDNGASAYERLREEPFSLLLTDIVMPEMDGFAFASAVRSDPRTADLPIIGLSSLISAEAIERGKEVGLHDYVAKFDRQGLIAALKEQTADMGCAA